MVYASLPLGTHKMEDYPPAYGELPGWTEDIRAARVWDDLPAACQAYVRRIEEFTGVKVGWISVGPERDQMVRLVELG